jgi:uncharacterized integral membrane protein
MALVIIVFSLVNRSSVIVDFWPLPTTMNLPLFAIVLVMLAVGVLWGGFAAWLSAGRARKRAREMTRRAEAAEIEVRLLEERNAQLRRDQHDTPSKSGDSDSKVLLPPADAA